MKNNYLFKLLCLAVVGLFGSTSWGQTTFNYTGAPQTYTVPAGVNSISIEAWGASGWTGSNPGGDGGYTYGELSVTPGQDLYIYVGGQGTASIGANNPMGAGWNGGGDGQNNGSSNVVGGGGGASDVRTDLNANPMDPTSLGTRVIVAGGGGGSTNNSGAYGGDGGGAVGQDGGQTVSYPYGTGGTQSAGGAAGGSFGQGGDAIPFTHTPWNGAGGGGWYGGGVSTAHCGGGGGSSYIGGVTAGTMTQGVNTGDGQIIITELCTGLTTTVSSSIVCDGEMVTLSATSTGTGTVSWDNGVVDGTPFTPPVGTTTYSATSTDGNDCGFSVDITVNALPTVTGTVDNATICLGDSITLTGAGADTYAWDNGATDAVAFAPASAGATTYTVTGTDANGCENSNTVDVQVNELTITGVITHETSGNDGEIDVTVAGGTGTNTFSWSSGETTEDITGLGTGDYTITVDDGVCIDSASFTVINDLSVGNSQLSSLEVYPNPVNNIVNIKLDGTFNYEIVNILGEIIISGQGTNSTQVDLSGLSRGAYFITVKTSDAKETLKVIKQ